jgi:16S rRNA (uracil1498-N3)-methyltransferase
MRLRAGATVLVFNGVDGEWAATLEDGRQPRLVAGERHRPQRSEPGPTLLVAPIKRPRLEWLLEKAVELGVGRILPVLTERSVVRPEASHRLRAHVIEAAEQCGRLTVPEVAEPMALISVVDAVTSGGSLGFADEAGGGIPLITALETASIGSVLIGPEGGFSPNERAVLLARPQVRPVSLGPLILRAETAAIYAMACWRAVADGRAGGIAGASSLTIREASTGGESR